MGCLTAVIQHRRKTHTHIRLVLYTAFSILAHICFSPDVSDLPDKTVSLYFTLTCWGMFPLLVYFQHALRQTHGSIDTTGEGGADSREHRVLHGIAQEIREEKTPETNRSSPWRSALLGWDTTLFHPPAERNEMTTLRLWRSCIDYTCRQSLYMVALGGPEAYWSKSRTFLPRRKCSATLASVDPEARPKQSEIAIEI